MPDNRFDALLETLPPRPTGNRFSGFREMLERAEDRIGGQFRNNTQ